MTCRLYEKQLSSYLDGELPAARAARLEGHLRRCPHCRNELSALSGIARHIRAASTNVEVGHEFDQRVLRAVGYWQVTGRQERRTLTKPLTLLALILLGLLGLVRHFLVEPLWPPVRAPQPAAAVVAPATPGGPVLPDRDRR